MEPIVEHRTNASQSHRRPTEPDPIPAPDGLRAATRIPDSIAVLSYATHVLARPSGGPRFL
jgi:hypothetical protein